MKSITNVITKNKTGVTCLHLKIRRVYVVTGNGLVVLKRTVSSCFLSRGPFDSRSLLGGGVLGDSLGTLTDGVLGELTGQEQSHGGLDFPGGDGATFVVVGQTAGFGGDPLKDVVHERVHD